MSSSYTGAVIALLDVPDRPLTVQCNMCDRRFVSKKALAPHLWAAHGVGAEKSEIKRPRFDRICAECGATKSIYWRYKRHFMTNQPIGYYCYHCYYAMFESNKPKKRNSCECWLCREMRRSLLLIIAR